MNDMEFLPDEDGIVFAENRARPIPLWKRLLRNRWVLGGVVGAVWVCIMAGLLTMSSGRAAFDARCKECDENVHQIALAMRQYQLRNGSLPPAYLADDAGRPIHSWRALLLPYLGSGARAARYHFDEPWDGPRNRLLRGKPMAAFACPNHPGQAEAGKASYFVVVGPSTAFRGAQPVKRDQIEDDSAKTILVLESDRPSIDWLEPRDIGFEDVLDAADSPGKTYVSGRDRDGRPHAIMVDQTNPTVAPEIDPATLRALLTIAGGERVRIIP